MSADKRLRLERLPEEITEEILARLPPDVLARFKLVCKNWHSLISSRRFVSAYLKHSQSDPSNHHTLLHVDSYWRRALPGPFRSVICCGSSTAKIVGSVNGLICLAGSSHEKLSPSHEDIWIFNPLTKQSMKLPNPPPSHATDLTLCDGNYHKFTFAFWCDSNNASYKVARIVSCLGNFDHSTRGWVPMHPKPNRGDVWDSSSPETWREIAIDFSRPFFHRPWSWVTGCDIVVGACAYWIVGDFNNKGLFVLSLNMDTLLLKPISLPPLPMKPESLIKGSTYFETFLFVTNWKGRFAFVARKEEVWTIKDSGSSCGDWNPPISLHLDFPTDCPLKIINGNGKLFLMLPPLDRITLFDIETQSFEYPADGFRGVSVASAHDFVGSYVTINGFKPDEPDKSHLPWTFDWPPKHASVVEN